MLLENVLILDMKLVIANLDLDTPHMIGIYVISMTIQNKAKYFSVSANVKHTVMLQSL